MYDYDTKMEDLDSHIFTNVSQSNVQAEYDYMYDDLGTMVYPDDLVMKVVFKKKKIIDCKFGKRLVTETFAKYVLDRCQ